MIRTDMEGVTGVVNYDQVVPGAPNYPEGRSLFMGDLLALLRGLNAGGAGEMVLFDEHYEGRNIDVSALPANTTAICGKPPYTADDPGGLSRDFAGMIMLGFHAKWATPGGTLPHSYEHDIADLKLNGTSVGEIGMEAAIAGDFDVPLLMVVGDSAGIAEAQRQFPGVIGVVTKRSIGATSAECYPAERTAREITEAARRCVVDPPTVRPYKLGPSVTLEVALNDGKYLAAVRRGRFASLMTAERVITLKGRSAADVWDQYTRLKLEAQAMEGQE